MARSNTSFEATIAAGIGIIGCIIGLCALIIAWGNAGPMPLVLVYDKADIAEQAKAYVAAGQDPLTVIDAAVESAVASGAIVIDGQGVKAPRTSLFHLDWFVEVGSEVGQLEDAASFLPQGITPMSAETISAQHAAQQQAQSKPENNPRAN
jgi:hypothetical protein